MRDLEIRGAGDMLGAMQHGHMSDVGYDMYMKLLGEAVSKAKGEKPKPEDRECSVDISEDAYLPEEYIPSLNNRLEMYRRIADIKSTEDASDVIDEMADRFGDLPREAEKLVNISLVRRKAQQAGINAIRQKEDTIYLYFDEIRCEAAANIVVKMRGRAKLNMGPAPNVSIGLKIGEQPGALLMNILK